MRLDNALVAKGLVESRNKAQEAIKSGIVTVNSNIIKKPSFKVTDSDEVALTKERLFVSRAAMKLEGFLREIDLDIRGRVALDIGSSTGGFTQVLLERGVESVDAVDVGTNQLHPILRDDSRVRVYEQTDIREFDAGCKYDLIVSDISFISLNLVLPHIDRLAKEGADIILLFKPQFEVGRDAKRDKRGVVTDTKAIVEAKSRFLQNVSNLGWDILYSADSVIAGKEGNVERVYHFRK